MFNNNNKIYKEHLETSNSRINLDSKYIKYTKCNDKR